MRTFIVDLLLALPMAFVSTGGAFAQDYAEQSAQLEIQGRISDGENKLGNSVVFLYRGNDRIDSATTDRNGKFHMLLALNDNYSFEFHHTGFVPKRIVIDTHMPKPKPDEEVQLVPIVMDVSMLEHVRYAGANTDDLDFPFAFIKYNRKTLMFEQDIEYTMDMQRTNGALLLMAARSDMKK